MMNIKRIFGGSCIGLAALLAVWATPRAFGAETVQANVPFAFEMGHKTLPAGSYRFEIDLENKVVSVLNEQKGPSAVESFVTTLAKPEHSTSSDAHIVFDKLGDRHILSEVWMPGEEGILVHATSEPHTHHVLHVKR